MKPYDPASLRSFLRGLAYALAASSAACSSTVITIDAGDAAPADVVDATPADVADAAPLDALLDVGRDTGSDTAPDVAADAPRDAGSDAPDAREAGACDPVEMNVTAGSRCLGVDVTWPCALPEALRNNAGGPVDMATCTAVCPRDPDWPVFACELRRSDGGPAVLRCNYACGVGRRLEGLRWDPSRCDGVGAWFAHVSALEGAAVVAFDRMAAELTAWGAPASLLEEVARARADEVSHAEVTGALARRWGAAPAPWEAAEVGVRALEDVARENAVEGCVRETWGALVAWWQAAHARDEAVAAALAAIAEDETRHAALSWRVHGWMRERLDAEAFARVEAARLEAADALRDEVRMDVPEAVFALAGLPRPDEAAALYASLRAHQACIGPMSTTS